MNSGLPLPPALGLEGELARGRFGVGGSVLWFDANQQPFWGAWASFTVVDAFRVFAGAASSMDTLSCPFQPGHPCTGGTVPGSPVVLFGLGQRSTFGAIWLDFSPSVQLGGAVGFNPGYSLASSFVSGPPLEVLR